MLLARSGRIDISRGVNGERGDFLLGRAVENKGFAIGRDAINQPAAVGSGNQVSLGIERESTNMDFIAFEEKRRLALRADFENLAMIAGRDIEGASIVENDVPDVFGIGIEVGGCAPGRFRICLGALRGFSTRRFETIDLAIGRGGRIDKAALVDDQSLYLQFLRLEDGRNLTFGRNAINAGRRPCGGIDVARGIRCNRPDVG